MTLLDTHVWVWWVQDDPALPSVMRGWLDANEKYGLGVSVISCLEVARAVSCNRLMLPLPTAEWIQTALRYPHIKLVDLTPQIAIESVQLAGDFHKDPCDRIIVATARTLNVPLATTDGLIRRYEGVQTVTY